MNTSFLLKKDIPKNTQPFPLKNILKNESKFSEMLNSMKMQMLMIMEQTPRSVSRLTLKSKAGMAKAAARRKILKALRNVEAV